VGTGEGTETIEKGDLILREIVMGRGPVSLVPVDVRIVHIYGSPIDAGIVHIHGNPVDAGTVHIHESPVNIETVHVHESMQTGV